MKTSNKWRKPLFRQPKGWSRRPQAACSSLFGRFAPCRRPPGRLEVPPTPKGSGKPGPAPYGAWQAKRWREGPRPRPRPSGPSRCPAGSGGIPRRRRKAARKSPRPIGGGVWEPPPVVKPPGGGGADGPRPWGVRAVRARRPARNAAVFSALSNEAPIFPLQNLSTKLARRSR